MPEQVTNVVAADALTTIYRLPHDEQEAVIAARVPGPDAARRVRVPE